ncbi:MAG TPA: LuxR C-terminal-related transcriptional regulator [Chloroflexota bacterium]
MVARPALFARLSAAVAGGVTLISAPAGSGKTVLLRSWIDAAGLADRVAWVSVERGERDAQRFWLAVVEKLRAAVGAETFVEKVVPTPEFTGEAVVARLVAELGSLEEPVVLVIDDLHELRSPEALAQLEALLARRPPLLHVVLATRCDPQLGLHRLRLAGELAELRAADLCFTLEQTRNLLTASGIALSGEDVARLQERTEGWAAGLRLAALSLAGHPEPERFVADFSGSERTVAEYLLAEVLERQPDEVRRLLLRTSILEWVNGALADVLTGTAGSERILHALEEANAFVVAVDAERSCFRYHHLFADLLRLELRRTEPDVVPALHRAAAAWHEAHGYVVEAIRHAQAADDWGYAARLLADHAFGLALDGQGATIGALLAAFPADARSKPELAAVFANQQRARGSLDDAAACIALAERQASQVPDERRHRFDVSLAVARLSLARRRGDFGSVLAEAQVLLAPGGAPTLDEVALGNELRALGLMNLGIVEVWSQRFADAETHLAQGLELARRAGRPYVEIGCLAHLGVVAALHSFALARERCLAALAIAEAHGWAAEPIACVPLTMIGAAAVAQGRFEEGRQWLDRAEQTLRPDLEPAVALWVRLQRGLQNAIQGRFEQALAAFIAAEQLQMMLVTPHTLTVLTRQWLVLTHLQLGDMTAARATLAKLSDAEREWGEARIAAAALHLAEGDPRAAIEVLAPVLDGTAPILGHFSLIPAPLLDAVARDRLGDTRGAEAGVERALALAEPDWLVLSFVLTSSRDVLERHPRHRTAHAALLADVLDVLGGSSLPARAGVPPELQEGLSEGELRVLRYLPSHLSTPEIGAELYVSLNTVKTHMRHIYAKLGVHGRTEAVERARELGLLGPSPRQR